MALQDARLKRRLPRIWRGTVQCLGVSTQRKVHVWHDWAKSDICHCTYEVETLDIRNLNGNAFDRVPCDRLLPSVVESRGAGVGVACEVLDIFEGDTLGEQIGHGGDTEGVGGEMAGETRISQAAFDHAADVDIAKRVRGELPRASGGGAKQWCVG